MYTVEVKTWKLIAIAIAICAALIGYAIKNDSVPSPRPTVDTLGQQIRKLQHLRNSSSPEETQRIDDQIATLQRQVDGLLMDKHLAEYGQRKQQEEEDAKHAEERAREARQHAAEEELAFRKHCIALEDKKIADLTVKDAEDLKLCGVSIPGQRVP